jgi:DNA invertase Pin-like site-specific DNA recombinase
MRAAVYTRISLDRTGEELGVTRQRDDCLALAGQRGWDVVADLDDNNVSAAGKVTRGGFEAVLSGIETGAYGAVIAWNLDRLTRNRRDTVRLIETGQRHGTIIALVRGSDYDLSTPGGRMTADILASVARNEIEVKGDRQRSAIQQRAKRGLPPTWGHRCFGFERDSMTVRPSEKAAVVDACAQILSGGSLNSVSRQWQAAGHELPTRRGDRWHPTSVRSILTNPRIAGFRTYHGEIVGRAKWPELVPEATWRGVVAVLTDDSRRQNRGVRTLLGSLLLCGGCGELMRGARNDSGTLTYRCRHSTTSRGHISRRRDHLDDYVTRLVIERLSQPDAADLLVDQNRPDVDMLRAQSQAARARLDEIAAMFGDGELTRGAYLTARAHAQERLTRAETAMADAGRLSVLGPLVAAEDVRAKWDGLDLDRQRAVIDALMTVTAHSPGRGRQPFNPDTVDVDRHENPRSDTRLSELGVVESDAVVRNS